MLTVGSLCTGYGGLELALGLAGVEHRLAWVADPDPAATAVLAHHHPDVPNLKDITAVDWSAVAPVEVLLAGYPCQGFSVAGQRKGINDDRFVWPSVADAVRVLRPRFVLLENVAGHRSLGFGRVLGDLAAIGYDAQWVSVRACDIGAAHRRERVFILAHPAGEAGLLPTPRASDTNGAGQHGSGGLDLRTAVAGLLPIPRASAIENRQTRRTPSQESGTHGRNLAAEVWTLFPTPDATHGRKTSRTSLLLPGVVELLPTPTAERYGSNQSPSPGAAVRHGLDSIGLLLPTPRATDSTHGGPNQRGSAGDLMLPSAVQPGRWGEYAPAVARWEHILGRPAPEPTEPGRNGPRLAARFVEWLMGLDSGHVIDVPGLSRNDMLRLLGNGVVPQQGAHAIRLMSHSREAVSCAS